MTTEEIEQLMREYPRCAEFFRQYRDPKRGGIAACPRHHLEAYEKGYTRAPGMSMMC